MSDCRPEKDCVSFPFRKRCAEFCIEQILRVARPNEKIDILGMDEELAEAIYSAYNSGSPINSFSDLRKKLSPRQIGSIKLIFDNLTQSQLNHFISRLK